MPLALLCTSSRLNSSFLNMDGHTCSQYSRWGLINSLSNRVKSSPFLLEIPQPNTSLDCICFSMVVWYRRFTIILQSSNTIRSFSSSATTYWWPPRSYHKSVLAQTHHPNSYICLCQSLLDVVCRQNCPHLYHCQPIVSFQKTGATQERCIAGPISDALIHKRMGFSQSILLCFMLITVFECRVHMLAHEVLSKHKCSERLQGLQQHSLQQKEIKKAGRAS